jgi:methyl-accepting chemotaxis protein
MSAEDIGSTPTRPSANVPIVPNLEQRLSNYSLDADGRAKLREMAPIIRPTLEMALDCVIEGAVKLPHVAAVWSRHGKGLRRLEIRQYEELLRGEFDEAYLQVSRRTAEQEAELGFENRARMNCGVIIGKLASAQIARKYRWSEPTERSSIVSRAIMFDIATTTTFFLELSEKTAKARRDKIDGAIANFDTTIRGVLSSIRDASVSLIEASAVFREVSTTAGRRLASASTLSSETSRNVVHTSNATNEMSQSIKEIAKQTTTGSDMAVAASSTAQRATEKMHQLDEAAEQIGSIVSLISGIARQTNLLALNATIEAARAGSAGRGFAVVASEVKALANQTEQATQRVADQIASIQTTSNVMATEITSLTNAIDSLATVSNSIASAVDQQEGTTRSISETMDVAAKKVAQTTDEIAAVAEVNAKSGSAIGELVDWTERLSRAAKDMESEVSSFFDAVREA